MPEFPKNTGFKMNKIKQGFTLKPQQTGWGSRSTKDLIRDANEAARWEEQRRIDAAEKMKKRDAKLFKGPVSKEKQLGTGKYFKNTDIFEPFRKPQKHRGLTPPYYKKPGFLKRLFGRRGEGGLIGQEYNDETGEMENVISGELGRDATVGGNDTWGNVANIFTAGQMNRGSGKGGRIGSMFRSVKNLFTGGAKAAMRKPALKFRRRKGDKFDTIRRKK